MSKPDDYGKFYWGINVSEDLANGGCINLFADEMGVTSNGDLVFHKKDKETGVMMPFFSIAKDKWLSVHPASILNGGAVNVEIWKPKLQEKPK